VAVVADRLAAELEQQLVTPAGDDLAGTLDADLPVGVTAPTIEESPE
jgi:hypothetical protein